MTIKTTMTVEQAAKVLAELICGDIYSMGTYRDKAFAAALAEALSVASGNRYRVDDCDDGYYAINHDI